MLDDNFVRNIAIMAIPVLFAITLHEAAHGYVARYFGDPTAEQAGRLTLNPLRHIDPIGTILVPLVLFFMTKNLTGTPILFGWAKPVPVNFFQLRRPKQHMLWVALAGPATNLLMMFGWALMMKAGEYLPLGAYDIAWFRMADIGMVVNAVMFVLNLLPLLPLDGGRVVASLLPRGLDDKYARMEPFGFPILIVLILTSVLGTVLMLGVTPLLQFCAWLFHFNYL